VATTEISSTVLHKDKKCICRGFFPMTIGVTHRNGVDDVDSLGHPEAVKVSYDGPTSSSTHITAPGRSGTIFLIL
jgi:hypothetical protein